MPASQHSIYLPPLDGGDGPSCATHCSIATHSSIAILCIDKCRSRNRKELPLPGRNTILLPPDTRLPTPCAPSVPSVPCVPSASWTASAADALSPSLTAPSCRLAATAGTSIGEVVSVSISFWLLFELRQKIKRQSVVEFPSDA